MIKVVNPLHNHILETYDIVEDILCEKIREVNNPRKISLLTSELLKVRIKRSTKLNERIFL